MKIFVMWYYLLSWFYVCTWRFARAYQGSRYNYVCISGLIRNCIDRFWNFIILYGFFFCNIIVSFIKFECESLKWVRFIADYQFVT